MCTGGDYIIVQANKEIRPLTGIIISQSFVFFNLSM